MVAQYNPNLKDATTDNVSSVSGEVKDCCQSRSRSRLHGSSRMSARLPERPNTENQISRRRSSFRACRFFWQSVYS